MLFSILDADRSHFIFNLRYLILPCVRNKEFDEENK